MIENKITEEGYELAKRESKSIFNSLFPYVVLKKEAVDTYVEEVKKSNLTPELKTYFIINAKKTIKKIKNQKAIATIAMKELESKTIDNVSEDVDEDWVDRFMDSASYVSSADLQFVWGKILAGELEKPGSTPPNMTRILSEITPSLANTFNQICSMNVLIVPLLETNDIDKSFVQPRLFVPYTKNDDRLRELGVSFERIHELESLGVLRFNNTTGYALLGFNYDKVFIWDHNRLALVSDLKECKLPIGDVMLTSVGIVLHNIIQPEEVRDYSEMLEEYLTNSGCTCTYDHGFKIREENGELFIERF